MQWHHNHSATKSASQTDSLVKTVINQPDFKAEHLADFSYAREARRLDEANKNANNPFHGQDQWRTGSVKIPLSREGGLSSEDDAPVFEVKGIIYQPLIEIIKAANQDPVAKLYHYDSHKLYCRHPVHPSSSTTSSVPSTSSTDTPDEEPAPEFKETRVHSESYNGDAAIDEEQRLVDQERNPDDPPELPYKVVPIYVSSDSTKVARFGAHILWPIYIFFACFSKYFRACPSCFAAHHLAYIPTVSHYPRSQVPFSNFAFCSSQTHFRTFT